MDFEQGKAIYGAKQIGNSLPGAILLLFTKPGLLFIIWLFFHLQHINNPEVRAAKDREYRQATIERSIKYCYDKRVRIAVNTNTPLAKDTKEICRQRAIAIQERAEAYDRKQAAIARERRRKEAEVIRKSQE